MSGLSAAPRGAPPETSPPAPGGIPPDRAAATGTGHAGAFGRLRPALFRAAACLVVAVAALLALPGGASAQENPVRPSWSLTPSGLSDGDEFRLIFLTSTSREATSSDIGVYNTFVQNRAAAGHMQIQSYSLQFRVVGSTAAVDARDNTSTTGTGVPIYWLNGAKVANNYADFYDGSWSNEANPKKESGTNSTNGNLSVFTGSNDNGTASGNPLGSRLVTTGRLNSSTISPLFSSGGRNATADSPFYGLSPVFTVKAGPSIADVSVTSRPADGTDTFGGGERVEVTVTFDEAVEVRNAGTAGADVYINVSVGNAVVVDYAANYLRQDHPRKLVFGLEVTSGMNDVFGLCIGAGCDDDTIALAPGATIVAAEDGVAAVTSFDAVETSWSIFGSIPGLTGGVCDRHPAVRDAIVAAVSAADTCADVTDSHLVDNVGSLDLSGEGIGALRKEDFEGLTSLHTLDLSGNALDHLPADLFEPLDFSMRTLKLNGNPLGALPAGLFDGLTGIQELDLADTGLTELPAGLFADLDSLQELRLVENRLRAFPAAALADVAGTLRDLFMRDNDIPSIAAGALDGMTRLRKLELQDNALASLPAGLFDDATELRELKLNDNALASLPDDLLRPLTKLEVVRLGGNPGFADFAPVVEAIPAQSVERGARVDLAAETGTSPWGDNVTWTWTQTDSSGTTVTLNDADTATPWFDAPTVSDETTFTFEAKATGRGTSGANASEGAETAQVTVPGRPSIVDVSVTTRPADGTNTFKRGDRIEITATFSEPVRLNNLSSIRRANINISIDAGHPLPTFHRQDHPNRLIFRHVVAGGDSGRLGTGNTSTTGNPGIISLGNLVSLTARSDGANARRDFEGGQTAWRVDGGTVAPTGGVCDRQHKVRDAIVAAVSAASTCAAVTDTHLAGIASLDLSGEGIDSLRKADFAGLAGLTELDLSGNALDYLPGDLFDHVAALTDLKLNGNDIAALPANVFNRLTALTDLTLQGNDIAALPANVFARLTALRRLDLRGNALTGLPAGVFAALTDLRGLRLSNNALASLPDNVFAPLTKLENGALWITNNPGFADFVPRITVAVPAQTVRPGVRVDLEAVVEPNPWGSNLVWSWTRTDTGGETVTLEDDDTRVAHFVAPAPAVETGFAFEVTATGRGTAGVSSPSKATEDAAVTVEDTTGPELVSAEVGAHGSSLALTFNENLDVGPVRVPPATAFTVKADGVEVPVQSVAVSAGTFFDTLLLNLSSTIGQRQIVTVSYEVPDTGTVIEDVAGNDALAFTDKPVTNNSMVVNTTPPVLTGGEVAASGDILTLTFNEDLDIGPGKLPPASAFTVKADGAEVTVEAVGIVVDLDHFLLTLSSTITDNHTVTVSYDPSLVPDTGTVIADTDGNPALAFTDKPVANNSTVDGTPPELEGGEVGADGDSLTLTFNEDLDIGPGKLPPASAFTVKADGAEVTVQSVELGHFDSDNFLLRLPAAAIGQRQIVTVSYAVPATGTVIADTDGNEALPFTDRRVTNNSTVFVKNAEGTPTISGVPQVGNTLTADTSAIADENDLPATLTYQWFRVATGGLETPVGTNSFSYTVSSADVGSTIRVDVSFTDGAGNPEGPLASDAVPAVAAAGTCPAGSDWRATLTMGYVLSETGSSRFHEFGFDPGSSFGDLHRATFPYGSTEVTVTLIYRALSTTLDGNTIRSDALTFTVSGGELPDGTVLNLGATAFTVGTDSQTTIAGQEQWNFRTLGLSPTWVGGQELTVCANLAPVLESAKADGTSLVLTYAEALDTGSTPAPGAYSVTVAGGAGPAVTNVSVSGDTVTLTLAAAVTAGPAVTLTYSPGSNPVQDESGLDAPGFSNRTVAVNNDAVGEPTISGVPQVGEMLTANVSAIGDTDGLPARFDYRWVRVAPGGAETDIGTNMSRYSPTYADVGSTIRVEVSFIDGAGYPEGPLASTATAAVPPTTTSGTCPADSDWEATLTLGHESTGSFDLFGFNPSTDFGALDPATITRGSTGYPVASINRFLVTSGGTITADDLSITVSGGGLPDGTVLNLGGTHLTVGTDSHSSTAGREQWDFLALGLSPTWVADQELTVCANLPPGLESATVEGTSLVLTYTEDLDTRSVPLPGAYSVTVNGTAAPPSSVSVSGSKVTLTLADPVTAGQSVAVEYTPGSNPVQDGSGLDALPLTGEEVANKTPPIPASAEVPATGNKLTLTFNAALDIGPGKLPPASAFTVTADGDEVTVQSVGEGTGPDNFILNLSSTIKQGQTVTVDYAVPTTNPIEDTAGNDALAFNDFEVTNNSTLEGTPPVPASAEVQIPGDKLTLTFNEDLDIGPVRVPPASAFTVTANGVDVPVQSVTANSLDSLILGLSPTITQGKTVTVSYAVPESGTVIEDTVGNDALAFTDFEVTNNSTVILDETPPVPASAEVWLSGNVLALTFNEDLDFAAGFPPASAFTVKADGVVVTVQSVTGAFEGLLLNLSPTIGARQIVTVSYAVPATGTVIEDIAGNDAVAFEDFPVTNNSTVANTTPPVPASAEVPASGASLTLTFNEDLDNGSDKLPPASAFTVTADGDDVPVQSVTAGSGADSFVLDLGADAIKEKQCHTVTVDYEVPTTNPIQDTDGNPTVAFTGFEVTNNSTVECPNDHSPVFPAPDPRMLTVEENVPLGTAIGDPVVATDEDGDTLTYSLDDTASVFSHYFQIDSATGQLQTNVATGLIFNHEKLPTNVYGIIVVADDGREGTDTAQITVVVSVTDVLEPPDAPLEVMVTGSGTTSLQVTWTAPPNLGRPAIEGYDVQYREVGASSWTDVPQDVIGTTSATITPVDAGKSYEVQVRATNDEGDGPWAVWGADEAVPVTIEAQYDSIGAGLEDLLFTLTREGDTTEALVATVTITQEHSWLGNSDLEHEVTFEAGYATAELTIVASNFSFTPSNTDDLTATVSGDGISGGEDIVLIVSTAGPPITVSLEEAEYSVAEVDRAEDVAIYVVAKLHPDYPRPPAAARDFGIAVSTESGTATFREDFVPITTVVDFRAGDYELVDGQYVVRKSIGFEVVDDQVYEGSEGLVVKVEASANLNRELVQILMPDGTAGDRYPVTITDEEDVPVLSLSVVPSSIAEEDDDGTTGVAENVSTVTVGITNGKTFAVDRTVTLTFSGDATEGTHYSVSPTDADTNAAGHQVVLPAGDASVEVTVTAAANDTADGNRTVTVVGDLDGTVIGSSDITIRDDETTTTNTDAEGKPSITGTPQVGQTLTADVSDIMDTNGLPSSYDYDWVSVDASDVETIVGNNNTYSPDSSDVDKTIKVEVSFTDLDGFSEGPLTSDAVGPVVAAEPQACVLGGDVWCATLTVQDLAGPSGHGCANSQSGKACSNPSHLTEDEFRHDGTDYDVTSISVATNGDLKLWLAPDPTAPTRTLVLVVDGERFALAHSGGSTSGSRTGRQWSGTGLSWSTGATVELRLVEGFPPLAPGAPGVNGVENSDMSLKVTWGAPNNAGRPPITHYDLRYRETGSGSWQSGPQGETGPNATIGSLTTGAEYDVQVRASNADGNGEWSPSGQGTPGVVETVETRPKGSLRLVDENGDDVTSTTGKGRLEVLYGNKKKGEREWGTVCDDRFDSRFADPNGPEDAVTDEDGKVANIAATLACRWSGAGSEGAMVTADSLGMSLAPENQPIWLDDVRCAAGSTHWRGEGTEPPTALHHCYHAGVGLHNCRKPNGDLNHEEDVYLECTGAPEPESAAQEEAAPLTASFEGLPDDHDGATAFTFRLVLSADIANGDVDVRDSAFEVTGGSVTDVGRVGGRSDLWEITVTPDGTGNIGIVLLADRACGTAGALCTADGRALTTALLVTVAANPQQAGALTAQFADMPAEHGGAAGFTFTLRFSESFPIGYLTMRDHAFTVTNGRVTRARRLDNPHHENQGMQPNREWEITVAPDTGAGDVTITLPETTDCAATGAVCTEDGTMLSGAVSATVPHTHVDPNAAAAPPLRASFANVPAEHDGGTVFTFEVRFSEAFRLSYVTMRDDVLRVTNGRVTRAQRLDNPHHEHEGMQPNRTWVVSVSPDAASEDVTIVLPATTSCDASGAVCTGDGRKLSNTESATVAGPPSLSIADAQVDEAAGATLEFTVSLSRAASATVTVDWATADGTATAGSDYTADSGTLNFAPDETSKTVAVAVLDDSHDEGNETLTVTLSNPSGAYLADSEATGTIENTDHMPQAWLSRFGRTVAEQVLDAVEERIRSAPQAGVQVTVAGQRIGAAQAPDADALEEAEAQARLEGFSTWLRGEACRDDPGAGGDCPARTRSREVTPRDLLTGTSFALTTGADGIGGGLVSLWGRGAVSSFDGREDELSLSGEVTGALLGADWTRERSTLGLMLSHARGEGSYRGADSGKVSSTVTGLYPYGRYAVTDRVTVWGSAGYGAGTLTLTPEDGETLETDMDLMMAAAGLRGTVVEAPPEGGPELAVKTDALAVRTSSEATGGGVGGNLAAAEADVTRLRLGLEGTWRGLEIGTGTLVPRLELGVRHDGGDAETGFGLDLGGGLAWSDPGTGVRAEVSARGLLTHESAGFRQRGIAGRLGWDPTPGSNRGPSLTLSQTMGVSARGGADALLGRTTLAGLAANDNGDELERRRLEVKLGYGFGAFGDRFTATPEVGFGMSAGHRDYSLAWRFVRDRRRGDIGSLEFSLEATRRESANDDAEPEHGVGLRMIARW